MLDSRLRSRARAAAGPPVTDDFDALAAELRALRRVGVCVVAREWVTRGGPVAARRRLLARVGYRDLARWDPLTPAGAQAALGWLLHRDLAYDRRFADPQAAQALAARFVAACGPGAWFTNGNQVEQRLAAEASGADSFGSAGWDPLSNATFDAGVLFEGPKHVALAWVEDED